MLGISLFIISFILETLTVLLALTGELNTASIVFPMSCNLSCILGTNSSTLLAVIPSLATAAPGFFP